MSYTENGAECPQLSNGDTNRQFKYQIDDRLLYMILSTTFPDEIPIEHPDFPYTPKQKYFTGTEMTGKDLVMCAMNRRAGTYPRSSTVEDAQRISNLFLLMWGTIPGRLEATEIYHSGNYLEGVHELESMIALNGGNSFVTMVL